MKFLELRRAKDLKVWVVVFVCMLTRVVHLELNNSLDIEHFFAAFDRFVYVGILQIRSLATTGEISNGANANHDAELAQDSAKHYDFEEDSLEVHSTILCIFRWLYEATVKSFQTIPPQL
ncbi:hypothetical protein PVAND_015054 [Polypedilum vanderplanki]|uniref:Uncharacterized protein n=1 Tax=Polypedilum vanderplanki TaxID=319348 RepID=A0A9J6BBT8_POLVA|nr:hypothetical protein PVAND_015054 [Polypedilum vanderplanki]